MISLSQNKARDKGKENWDWLHHACESQSENVRGHYIASIASSEIRTVLFVFLNGQFFLLEISNSIAFAPEACSSYDSIVTIRCGSNFAS